MEKTVWAYRIEKYTAIAKEHFSSTEYPQYLDFWTEFEKVTEGPVTEEMAYNLRDLMNRFGIAFN